VFCILETAERADYQNPKIDFCAPKVSEKSFLPKPNETSSTGTFQSIPAKTIPRVPSQLIAGKTSRSVMSRIMKFFCQEITVASSVRAKTLKLKEPIQSKKAPFISQYRKLSDCS
jgi:hypothetical protein